MVYSAGIGRARRHSCCTPPGRKTGKVTVNPLVAAPHGDAYVVCGTAGGAPKDPDWVANLEAIDEPVTIELGSKTLPGETPRRSPGSG